MALGGFSKWKKWLYQELRIIGRMSLGHSVFLEIMSRNRSTPSSSRDTSTKSTNNRNTKIRATTIKEPNTNIPENSKAWNKSVFLKPRIFRSFILSKMLSRRVFIVIWTASILSNTIPYRPCEINLGILKVLTSIGPNYCTITVRDHFRIKIRSTTAVTWP